MYCSICKKEKDEEMICEVSITENKFKICEECFNILNQYFFLIN